MGQNQNIDKTSFFTTFLQQKCHLFSINFVQIVSSFYVFERICSPVPIQIRKNSLYFGSSSGVGKLVQ